MVHWIWLLAALWAGVIAGIFVAALLQAARTEPAGETNEMPTLRTH